MGSTIKCIYIAAEYNKYNKESLFQKWLSLSIPVDPDSVALLYSSLLGSRPVWTVRTMRKT